MLKTIKTTKQLRLDELIKYVWENSVNEKRVFLGNHGQRVVFDDVGGFYPSGYAYSPDTTFPVEIEEPITDDMEFEELYTMMNFKSVYRHDAKTIKEIKECFNFSGELELLHQIYAMVDGKLELIWEREY